MLCKFKIPKILFLLFFILSCKAKFKKSEWNYDLGILDENRLEMVEDLRNNYFHKGMSISEIKKLIGNPNYIKNDTISYLIYEDY